jgi:hypothetical protein
MSSFIFGVVTGIVLTTVGFTGMAEMGDRNIQVIQSFVKSYAN